MPSAVDVERVICRLADVDDPGARGFTLGIGDWPLRGLLVRIGDEAWAYVNRCPHARFPLNSTPHRFLTSGGELILCSMHGALFDRRTGYCIAGPCAGQSLTSVPVKVEAGFVMLADEVDSQALADQFA
jgi:nitrite reductase/ring-hydroxylating ferredoxin subunit